MFEAYRIQSTLILDDKTTPVLLKMAAEFEKMERKVKQVQKTMDLIGRKADDLNRTASAIQMMSRHLSTAEARSARLLAHLTAISRLNLAAASAGVAGVAAGAAGRPRNRRAAASGGASSASYPAVAGGNVVLFQQPQAPQSGGLPVPVAMLAGAGVGAALTGGARGGAASNVIPFPAAGRGGSLPPSLPPGGGIVPRGGEWQRGPRGPRGGTHWSREPAIDGDFREVGGGRGGGGGGGGPFSGWRFQNHGGMYQDLHAGMILSAIGGFGIHGLYGATESAGHYQLEQMRLKSLGMPDEALRLAETLAAQNKQYGVTRTQSLALLRDAQQAFRDSEWMHHAQMVFPTLSKLHYATEVLGDEQGKAFERQFMDVMKVAEFRGGMGSRDAFERQANMAYQAYTSTGGRIRFSDYLTFLRNSGVAAYGLTDQALYYGLEPVLQELGPSMAATGLQTAFNRVQLGIGLKQAGKYVGDEMLRIGFLDRAGVEFDKKGRFKQYKPGERPMLDQGLQYSDPVKFYTDFVVPRYTKAGIATEQQRQMENLLIFGRTGGKVFNAIDKLLPIILKSLEVTPKAYTIGQAAGAAAGTKEGAEARLAAAWENTALAAGLPSLKDYTSAVHSLSRVLESGAKAMNEHQTATKAMTGALGVLFGAAMVGGAWRLGKAAAAFVGLAPDLALMATTAPRAAAALAAVALWIGRLPALAASAGIGFVAGKTITENSPWLQDKINRATDYLFGNPVDDVNAAIPRWEHERRRAMTPPGPPMIPPGAVMTPEQRRRLNTVHPGAGHGAQGKPGDVYLDGRRVGRVIAPHLGKEAAKPQAGASRPDRSMHLPPPAAGAGR